MARKPGNKAKGSPDTTPASARQLAIEAIVRIERDSAYANLLLPQMLTKSALDTRDKGFVTELVYGSTRMKRACDYLVDRFIADPPPVEARAALRIGAYQIVFLGTPPHAAVNDTVGATAHRFRGLVNAVLRKLINAPVSYPTEAIRLS
ncbi:MAG: transcription antitermination factor NusB, partial [Acidimicrobiales bacterium]